MGAGGGGEGERTGTAPSAAEVRRPPPAVDRLSLRQQVGQLLISSFDGPGRPEYLRRRLAARETAGVILFGRNVTGASGVGALARSIQGPARGRALVMLDQEGGDIRILPFASPAESQPEQGSPAAVRGTARRTARQLRLLGVNVNLAPVADVSGPGSVMGGRAFAGGPAEVARATSASVRGLQEGGVAATVKHFPGLGDSAVNTDLGPATVRGSLADDLAPFAAAVEAGAELVMLSHALYPRVDARAIASQSRRVATGVLRGRLGFDGVAVTDSMEAQAVLARSGVAVAAERAVAAGADLILMTGSASWNEVFPRLLRRARRSPAFRERVRESATRVLALKRRLAAVR